MQLPAQQLDRRFAALKPWAKLAARPSQGWIRAVRRALGMTTAQMAKRMQVTQPRIVELEQAEIHGNITLSSLERAGKAMGCRVVYVLIPDRPLTETMKNRAQQIAERRLASVEQTMLLEAQSVDGRKHRHETLKQLVDRLMHRPSGLWNDA
ncbi:MAG TPA: mobile mystery protein A [Rhizomicrobium sp.]|nr:mobile mystery protein A [Rhizomicrobium sp.]